jgi:hypothetical protein
MADVGVGIRLEPRSWVRGRGIAGSRDGAIEAMFEVSEDCVRGQRRGSVQPRQMLTMSKANSVLGHSSARPEPAHHPTALVFEPKRSKRDYVWR